MSTISFINNGKWLPFYLPLASAFKDNDTAIFLSKLVNKYEFHKHRDEIEEDGWFFATVDQIEEDVNLSVFQQKRIIKKLKTVGFIDMKLMGMPSKRYFKLHISQIESFLTTGCPRSFIQEKLSIKVERNSRSDTRETLDQGREKLMTSNNTVTITQYTITHNENTKGDFSEKTNLEDSLKDKKTQPSTVGGGGEAAERALMIGNAIIERASRPKMQKKGYKHMPEKIKEMLDEVGLIVDWERWRQYKYQVHKFQYFDEKSEIKALNGLNRLAGNDIDKAIELIDLAISSGWKGFYLPNNSTNEQRQKNGQPRQKNVERFKQEFILEYNQQRGCEPTEDELALAVTRYEREF